MLILGCGYLGTALAQSTLGAGQAVLALTRSEARAGDLRAFGLGRVVAADIATDDWHGQFSPAGESIVFCVAPSRAGEDGYRHSFVEGAKSIGRWLANSAAIGQDPARELVFTSSTSVYPQSDGGWVDEASPVDAQQLGPAGRLLRETEEVLRALPPRLIRRVWILRLAGLYGPQRHHLLDALRAGESTFPGNGENWVNLLHRDDAVRAIQACLAAPAEIPGGVFNIADDEPVRKRDLMAWLAEQLGRNSADLKFDSKVPARSRHRQNAAGKTPNRRVSNARFKNTIRWNCISYSYRVGYMGILP